MKITIDNASQFRDQFHRAGRGDQFSYEALGILFDYLEDCVPDYDLDVIALCCDYSESTAQTLAADYNLDTHGMDDIDCREAVRDYLDENTAVVGETANCFVFANF